MKKNWILRNPDPVEGQGDTGAGPESVMGDGVEMQTMGGEQPQDTAAVQPPVLNADTIAEAFKKAGVGQPAAQPQAQPDPTITPEEFDKMFNVRRADETLMRQVFDIPADAQINPERVKAFNEFCQGLVRQAVSMAAYQTQAVQDSLAQRFNPALEMARRQQEEALKQEFFSAHKDLKEYEPLLVAVKDRLIASGFKGSKEEAFKRIAEETRAILKTLPGVGQSGGSPVQPQSPKPASKMSTVSSGGQGGSGGGKLTPKSGPAAIFS